MRGKCRLLHNLGIPQPYQGNTIYSTAVNNCEQEQNKAARCKAVPSDPYAKENPGATAIASGVKGAVEGVVIGMNDTASLAARHPIIALHWGFAT